MSGSHFHPTIFKFIQATPAATWVINHNLGGNGSQGVPMVDVYIDNSGVLQKVLCNVTMNDKNTCTLTFVNPQSGQAVVIV